MGGTANQRKNKSVLPCFYASSVSPPLSHFCLSVQSFPQLSSIVSVLLSPTSNVPFFLFVDSWHVCVCVGCMRGRTESNKKGGACLLTFCHSYSTEHTFACKKYNYGAIACKQGKGKERGRGSGTGIHTADIKVGKHSDTNGCSFFWYYYFHFAFIIGNHGQGDEHGTGILQKKNDG